MPSASRKQHNLMAMVANDPAAAKRLGIPQSVGKEFTAADKGRKFAKGGDMKESKGMMKKEVSFMKAKGAPKSMIKHEEAEMAGMKRGGGVKKMAMGGDTTGMGRSKERKGMTMEKMGKVTAGGTKKFGEHSVQTKGHTRGRNLGDSGKTVGIQRGAVGMKKGGRAC